MLPKSPGKRARTLIVAPAAPEMTNRARPSAFALGLPDDRGLNVREMYSRTPPFSKNARAACHMKLCNWLDPYCSCCGSPYVLSNSFTLVITSGWMSTAVDIQPDVITSVNEFERTYGDPQQLQYGSSQLHNFMWHAARAFFENGGVRLYISRTFNPLSSGSPSANADGRARFVISGAAGATINVLARFPGDFGNMRVRFTLQLGPNVLGQETVNGK